MIDGNYLARRTISHLINMMKISERNVKRMREDCIRLCGFDYFFGVEGESIEVIVEQIGAADKEKEDFKKYMENAQTTDFWKKDFLKHLKEQKSKYKGFLRNLEIKLNSVGDYHFKAELNTKNEDNVFFAVLYNVVRVVYLYSDSRVRES